MMLAAALLAQAAPAPEPDIVIIARRLQGIEVTIRRDPRGRYTCDLSASSGSARLDTALCKASVKCAKKASDAASARQCVAATKPRLLEQWRREWTRSRAR